MDTVCVPPPPVRLRPSMARTGMVRHMPLVGGVRPIIMQSAVTVLLWAVLAAEIAAISFIALGGLG